MAGVGERGIAAGSRLAGIDPAGRIPGMAGIDAMAIARGALTAPAVLAWLVHLALVLPTAAVTVALTPGRDKMRPELTGLWHYLAAPLATWDGGWYIRIAGHGYGRRQEAAAFWPFYPLLLRFGHGLTGLPYAAVGLLLSNAAFLGALLALFALVRREHGTEVATRAVWLTALGPLAFFFSAVYTESFFLLLTVSAVALARSRRWAGAALLAALVALTRNSGALVLLPLAAELVRQRGWRPRRWWPPAIQLAAAGAAPLAFAAHLNRLWGTPLLIVRVQAHWGRTRGTPWDTLRDAYERSMRTYLVGRHGCSLRLDRQALDACSLALKITRTSFSDDLSFLFVFSALALFPYALARLATGDVLYLAAGIAFPLLGPATFDPLLSDARYLIGLYPLYIAIALLLRRRSLFVATLAVSAIALVGLLALFAQRYFVA